MERISEIIEIYYIEIVLKLSILFLLLLAFYIIAQIRINKLKNRYETLTRGMNGVNIEEILIQNGNEIDNFQNEIEKLNEQLNRLSTQLTFAIQKVGFIRYNAFDDMGSELSFSIALLDNFSNGFVLTSIYGRDQSISYAKPIKDGKSVYPLSVEEMQAIDRAIKGEAYYAAM